MSELLEDPTFAGVATAARKQIVAAGGGAMCIYHRGRPVLDLWAGHRDAGGGTPWTSDTMGMAWSTTKGVASTAIHMLVERGKLGYDDRVADHWPEFGVNGKEATTIRHVLSMEAGLYDIRHLITEPEQMLDHDVMAGLLAAARPAHAPGTKNGYHALTYGWLIGEIVRRVSGVSLGTFVRTEIAEPLALDGFHIGVSESELARVADIAHLPPEKPAIRLIGKALNPVTSLFGFSLNRYAAAFLPQGGHRVIPTPAFLQAEVAGANGVFTARSLARFYAALSADDGVDGVTLWTPETRRAAVTEQNSRRDQVLALRVRWRLGFHRPVPKRKVSADAFGFYGAFGSGAFCDPARELAVGLVVRQAKGFPLSKLMGSVTEAAGNS